MSGAKQLCSCRQPALTNMLAENRQGLKHQTIKNEAAKTANIDI